MVKEFLSQRGIRYREKDVSVDRLAARELVTRTGQMGVPVTIIDGQSIVGFNRAQLEQVLKSRQGAQRTSFGAAVADADKITTRHGSEIIHGAYIGKVKAGSAAERLGLMAGDVIIQVNTQLTANAAELERVLSGLRPDNRLSVIVVRGDRRLTLEGAY